mmetsp:Transcript_24825/g.78173  ORF Transcript_24825/g.78173 Transcript_24825/m.78173 type:complete len:314 (-) Transcript_24825:1673-2614(-)
MRQSWKRSSLLRLTTHVSGSSNSKAEAAKNSWKKQTMGVIKSLPSLLGKLARAMSQNASMQEMVLPVHARRRVGNEPRSMRLTVWPQTKRRSSGARGVLGRAGLDTAWSSRDSHSSKPDTLSGPSSVAGRSRELRMASSHGSMSAMGPEPRRGEAASSWDSRSRACAASGSSRVSCHTGFTLFGFTDVTCRKRWLPDFDTAVSSTKASVVPQAQLQRGRCSARTMPMRQAPCNREPAGYLRYSEVYVSVALGLLLEAFTSPPRASRSNSVCSSGSSAGQSLTLPMKSFSECESKSRTVMQASLQPSVLLKRCQ